MKKLYCCFESFFFLRIQLPTTHHELLKKFQPWKICIGTLKYFLLGIQLHTMHYELLKNIQPWESCIGTILVLQVIFTSIYNLSITSLDIFRVGNILSHSLGWEFVHINSFLVSVPILYPLKTQGNQKASAGNHKAECMNCIFMPWILDSLDQPRYGSESHIQ